MSKEPYKSIESFDKDQKIQLELEQKVKELQKKIEALENENNKLLKRIERVRVDQESVEDLQNKMYQLNKRITELEEENLNLSNNLEKPSSDQNRVIELENEIIKLKEEIERLNYNIVALKEENKAFEKKIKSSEGEQSSTIMSLKNKITEQGEYISFVEKENMEFREKLAQQQSEQSTTILDENMVRLQKRITVLENENKELVEKNQILKAALLLHVDTEASHISQMSRNPISIPNTEIPKGKVKDLVNKRHEALESKEFEIIKSEPEQKAEENRQDSLQDKETKGKREISRSVTSEETNVDDIGVIITSEGRRKCPICGNINKRFIQEVVDKAKVISTYGGLFGKKYKCAQCGAEWK